MTDKFWSTTSTVEDGRWHFRDSETGELLETCPNDTGEWLVRHPDTGGALGLVQSDFRKPVNQEHAKTASDYLLLFFGEDDYPGLISTMTLMNYAQSLISELQRIADAEPSQRDRIRQVLNGGAS